MRKREFVFAAIAAALLSVGSAKVATAQDANCDDCAAMYGDSFYKDDYWIDDVGQLGGPGEYYLVGCDENWCYYYGGGAA